MRLRAIFFAFGWSFAFPLWGTAQTLVGWTALETHFRFQFSPSPHIDCAMFSDSLEQAFAKLHLTFNRTVPGTISFYVIGAIRPSCWPSRSRSSVQAQSTTAVRASRTP
jgi:hypothetical protein